MPKYNVMSKYSIHAVSSLWQLQAVKQDILYRIRTKYITCLSRTFNLFEKKTGNNGLSFIIKNYKHMYQVVVGMTNRILSTDVKKPDNGTISFLSLIPHSY